MCLIHESDARFGAYDFYGEQIKAPEDLKFLTEANESLPFRRRGYERDAMLQSVIERVGFEDLQLRVKPQVLCAISALSEALMTVHHLSAFLTIISPQFLRNKQTNKQTNK
jgi:hypothetical protein